MSYDVELCWECADRIDVLRELASVFDDDMTADAVVAEMCPRCLAVLRTSLELD